MPIKNASERLPLSSIFESRQTLDEIFNAPKKIIPYSEIDTKPRSTASFFMESLKNVGRGFVKDVGSQLAGASELGEKGLQKILGIKKETGVEQLKLKEKLEAQGTEEKIGAGIAEIATFFLPGTASVKLGKAVKGIVGTGKLARLAQIGTTAATEAGIFGGITAAQRGEVGEESRDAAILGALFPVGGALLKTIPKPNLPNFAGRIVDSLIKPLKKDLAYGKQPGYQVAKEGITGNSLGELATNIEIRRKEVGTSIGDIISKSDKTKRIDIKDAFTSLDNAMEQANKAPRINASLIKRLKDTKLDLMKGKQLKNLTPEDVWDIKQTVAELTKFTGNPSDDKLVNKALKQIYGGLKEKLNKAVPGLDELNERYANLLSAEIATKYREQIAQRLNLLGLGAKLTGTAGAIVYAIENPDKALSTIFVGMGVAGIMKALESPAVKTRIASALAKMGREKKAELFRKIPILKQAIDRVFGTKETKPTIFPKKKPPTELYGAVAGVEPEVDEQGRPIGVKFSPEKALLGMAGMTVAKKGKTAFSNLNKTPLGQKIIKTGEQKPTIKLKRDVTVTTLSGEKVTIPEDEVLKAYEQGGKTLLKDGREYIVSKSQYENIKNNSLKSEAKEFAPELSGTEEVVKGKKDVADLEAQWEKKATEVNTAIQKYGMTDKRTQILRQDRDILKDKIDAATDIGTTKFSSYQLPEGKNYKEILIKAPTKTLTDAESIARYDKLAMDNYSVPYNKLNGTEKTTINRIFVNESNKSQFKYSHWDEPNVISHLRLNERTYKGKKVTFMEEMQSDWAREGRSKGFTTVEAIKEYEDYNKLLRNKDSWVTNAEKAKLEKLRSAQFGGIPNNPLLKNWQELSVKRALKEAVDNNSEYLAWINGEQTSARYNLATHLENVKWKSDEAIVSAGKKIEGGKRINLKAKGGQDINITTDSTGKIEFSSNDDWTGKKLDAVLGKGLADKIMEKETGQLSGEGLAFGGEWAKNLYDKQVKNIVEDITGHKVEVIDMGLPIKGDVLERWYAPATKAQERIGIKPVGKEYLKIGRQINKTNGKEYIITDVLGSGKFKAVKKSVLTDDKLYNRKQMAEEFAKGDYSRAIGISETFDISTKQTVQQAIKITPEIRAMVKGESPVKGTIFGRLKNKED